MKYQQIVGYKQVLEEKKFLDSSEVEMLLATIKEKYETLLGPKMGALL